MTNELHNTPDQASEDDHSSLTEYVSHLLSVITGAYLRLMNGAAGDAKAALRYAMQMQRMIRRTVRINYRFAQYERREALRHNPDLRRQVRYDLGGKMAMVKWERRRREAKVALSARNVKPAYSHIPMPDFAKPTKSYPRKTPCKWKPKTDRSGHYRLAAIKTGPMENPPKRKPKAPTNPTEPKVTRRYEMRFLPLEVMPDEISPRPAMSSGYVTPPNTGYPLRAIPRQ